MSGVVLQTAADTAFMADGELADTAFLEGAAALTVTEIAFCGGDVGGVPAVVGDVEDGQRRLLKLDGDFRLLRSEAGGGYCVMSVWKVGEIGGGIRVCICG